MKTTVFWKSYALVTTGILLLLAGIQMAAPKSEALGLFSFVAIASFSALLILFFNLARASVSSSDPYRFVRLMLMLFLIKFFLCVVLVAVYWKLEMPEHKVVILPFLLIYLIYTIFEVYFLSKIARVSPGQSSADGARETQS